MGVAAALLVGSTALVNFGFACLLGALLARVWLANVEAGWGGAVVACLRRAELAALAACLIGGGLACWAVAAQMADVPLSRAGEALRMMLAETRYGCTLGAAQGTLLPIAALCGWRGRHPGGRADKLVVAALLLVFAALRASLSHAAEDEMAVLDAALEWLHLLLTGGWVGAVTVAAWIVLPVMSAQREDVRADIGRYLAKLSQTATLALAGIVATGVYNAAHRLRGVADLIGDRYGLTLSVKLALVALAVGLGAYNRIVGLPAVSVSSSALPRFIGVLRGESIVLIGALVAAAALASQMPPAAAM